jgi:hypothetical protein
MYGEGVTINSPLLTEEHQLSPCPESSYIGCAALHAMLLASDPDGQPAFTVFPTLDAAWPEAAFFRLRALDGTRVSASRQHAQTLFVQLESPPFAPAPQNFTLSVPDWQAMVPGLVPKVQPADLPLWLAADGVVVVTMPPGSAAVVYIGEQPARFAIRAAPSEPAEENYLGFRYALSEMTLQCVGVPPTPPCV